MNDDQVSTGAGSGTAAGAEIVFVTGPAGAGRSTAVKSLEDLGYEVIDNLPLSLLSRLLEGPPHVRPLALGIDIRNRDFSVQALIAALEALNVDPTRGADLLYLDCDPDVLIRRFSETRRPHPLSPADPPAQSIAAEIGLLAPIRDAASVLVDTSDMSPHDLRAEIGRWFGRESKARLVVSVQSFSYRRGLPRGVDMVFDTRFLANPHWEPGLRTRDGRDPDVADFVRRDPRFGEFFDKVRALTLLLLPAFRDEGKSYLTIAFGCTGGQHRSVALAEALAIALEEGGWQVSKRHRELDRGQPGPSTGAVGTDGDRS